MIVEGEHKVYEHLTFDWRKKKVKHHRMMMMTTGGEFRDERG
jgi:hypothetical protein